VAPMQRPPVTPANGPPKFQRGPKRRFGDAPGPAPPQKTPTVPPYNPYIAKPAENRTISNEKGTASVYLGCLPFTMNIDKLVGELRKNSYKPLAIRLRFAKKGRKQPEHSFAFVSLKTLAEANKLINQVKGKRFFGSSGVRAEISTG